MTISDFEYQEFQSGPDTFEVRVIPGTPITQGRAFVMWDDIQDVFPNAARLQSGRRIISFMVDANGNRLLPLRIEHHPDEAIQVIMCRASSLPLPNTPPPPPRRPSSVSKHSSYIATFTLQPADGEGSNKHDSLLSTWSISDEAKNRYRSSVFLYESFLQSLQYGDTNHASMIREDFHEQFHTLEAEMSRNKTLEQQMLEMQQSMLELQQQALDKLAIIQTRVQAILAQNYALVDYPIPRLFIILPNDGSEWDPVNIFENQFRVHFLCECGEHTKTQPNKMPHHIHLAKHQGYEIEHPQQFFWNFGSYALSLLHMFKYGAAVAGHTVPALGPPEITGSVDGRSDTSSSTLVYSVERSVDQAMEFLECMSMKGLFAPTIKPRTSVLFAADNPIRMRWTFQQSYDAGMRPQPALQGVVIEPTPAGRRSTRNSLELLMPRGRNSMSGSIPVHSQDNAPPKRESAQSIKLAQELGLLNSDDLQRMVLYLKATDSSQFLGDMYRTVTISGYAKWVCEDHYREAYGSMAIKELTETIAVNDGVFEEHLGRVEIVLSSSTVASLFYRLMERSKLIQDLKVSFKWDASYSDLKALRDAVYRLKITCLDLTCSPAKATSDYLNRNKRSDPLWETIVNSKLQSFVLNDYTGFFSKMTVEPQINHLRVLSLSERLDWKKEGPKVIELIGKSPLLKELRLSCLEVEEAYAAVKKINLFESCMLQQLSIDGGESKGLVARFESGLPVSMDLIFSDLASPFLQETKVLQSLHLRPGLHVRVELDPNLLIGIINRNLGLAKLTIQCAASEFLWWHTIVRNAIADDGTSKLRSLKLYGGLNQLHIGDLQDDNTIQLELMSINMPRDSLEALLKIYRTRLTKLRIEGDALRHILSVAFNGETLALKQVDIVCSILTADMLYDLRLVLRRAESTLRHLSIVLDVKWDASERSNDLADFVVEFAAEWKKITIDDGESIAWKQALHKRGFVVPTKVLAVVSFKTTDYLAMGW